MAWRMAMGGAAVLLCLAVAPSAKAGEKFCVYLDDAATIPAKGITGGDALMTVDLDDESADATEYVWWRGGWGGHVGVGRFGFYRPFVFSGRASRFTYGNYWRPFAFYRPYYGGGYYGGGPGYYYGGPSYYYNPCPTPYYYYYSYAPLTVDAATAAPAVASAQIRSRSSTYPYDGGPNNPVPMPRGGPDANPAPRLVPPDTVEVSTTPARKHTYPAYGETPARTLFAEDRPVARR